MNTDMQAAVEEAAEVAGLLTVLATRLAKITLDRLAKVESFEEARDLERFCERQRIILAAVTQTA